LSTPIATTTLLNIGRFSLAFAIPTIALTGPIGISILVGSLIVGAVWTGVQINNIIKQA